ncbi:MAG TPA: ATP-binding protein [Pyrinomonadaceae bacterium]|jgi:two-component system sensor histidine kinase PilS (NtrC family)
MDEKKPNSDRSNADDAPHIVEQSSNNSAPINEEDSAAVTVYRRTDPVETSTFDGAAAPASIRRVISPATIPLVAGFVLLLLLIGVVGWLSMRRMNEVGLAVLDLEQTHAARLGLLLRLRLAVTKLDNEARSRDQTRGELHPPFDLRLGKARGEARDMLSELQRTTEPAWQNFANDLAAYIEATEDPRQYSLEGFKKFKTVDAELNSLQDQAERRQVEIFSESEAIQKKAAQSIRDWSLIALLFGLLVAAGTVWEIQRRFGEMRRSVEAARRERSFTSQLLEGMVSAVAAIDDQDRIRSANAAFFKIFPRATIGASVYEKFASDDAMKMLEAATGTLVDRASYRGRWVCAASGENQSQQTFDLYSSPLAIDDAHGQILTMVDVTEAAEAERGLRRQESLAAVGQATAQVAHEIRNPLGSIRLGVSMLRDSVSDADGLNTIELVERGIKHLSKLVVDVAQFSRRKALEQASVDINELVDHSLDLVADKVNEKNTPIEKHFTGETPVGHWDFDQLSQVFVNVIANAIDASPKGAPVIIATEVVNASAAPDEQRTTKRMARVTITDQGTGMDKATVDRIFEPFFSTKKRGTGLGLAIVKQIVEQHEGTISVASEPGKGTRFTIDLPL